MKRKYTVCAGIEQRYRMRETEKYRERKFNALNCFVAPLQNWLKKRAKKYKLQHIRVHIAYRVLLCRTVTYTHTIPHHRLAYAVLH